MNSKVAKKRTMGNRTRFSDSFPKTRKIGILGNTLRGFAISLIIGIILTLVVSAIVFSAKDPNRYVTPAAFTVLYVCSLLGGFVSSRLNGGSPLLCGLLYSAMLLVLLLLGSLLFGGELSSDYSIQLAIGLRALVVVAALIGAFIGVYKKPARKKRKR